MSTPNPLRFGTDEEFARVKQLFVQAGFHDSGGHVHVPGKDTDEEFLPLEDGTVPVTADAEELFTGIFLRCASADKAHLERIAGPQGMADLTSLGMIAPAPDDPGKMRAEVRVRPMFGLHVASDHWGHPDTKDLPMIDDFVYPPDIGSTARYLAYIPWRDCESFLEVCGGSGIAALIAASNCASTAYSFDITERSTIFARFNGRLNGLKNFSASAGDAYAPANGRQFDRIVAHPPYVPVLKPTWIFHGGGVDGEFVTKKVVQGLPDHLAPGGSFFCRCVGNDRKHQNFEQRIRSWLGKASGEFDVALSVADAKSPLYYVTDSILRGRSSREDLRDWEKAFTDAEIARFITCFFVIQRRKEPRPVFTVRRDQGPDSGPRELAWLVNWETARCSPGTPDRILQSRLRFGPATLRSVHRAEPGNWALSDQFLAISHPFQINWPVEPWTVFLMPKADGSKTGAELHALLRDEEVIHPDVEPQEFATALAELISGGMLIMEGAEPPEIPTRQETQPEKAG